MWGCAGDLRLEQGVCQRLQVQKGHQWPGQQNFPFLKTLSVNLAQFLISLFDVCGPHFIDGKMEAHKGKMLCLKECGKQEAEL